ncbi:MAG TPA: KTSC domain-containing protein [Cyclobacteriaceae bacterium]|nr:KTSC domain-containing protein [Cyclobacteriaceae bacterium]
MKKIIESRKVLGVTKDTELKELKTIYRNFMKEFHPDKVVNDEAAKLAAEEKSKAVIEAYQILVSVAPETHAQQLEKYTEVITVSRIENFQYKGQTLTIDFIDGSSYEYFGIPRNVYNKLVSSDTPDRFARRHIYHEFVYRRVSRAAETA